MFAASKTASVSGGYQISRSLRFNSPDSTNVQRTFSTTGTSQTTSTLSMWFKRGDISRNQRIFDCYDGSSGSSTGVFLDNDVITLDYGRGSGAKLVTTQVLRDVSAWYHLVAVFDSSNATSSNRLKLYLNGSQITTFSTAIYPSQNALNNWMSANSNNRIGSAWDGSANFSGYITEINFIDGQALTSSSFGETNAQTGVWQPKAYSGSYGTNGFYLNFSDNSNTTASTLGKDYSGNGNNWTPNNFSVTAGIGNDSLVDSPTSYGTTDTGVGGEIRGNYCTLNPLINTSGYATLSNGNLDVVPDSTHYPMVPATFGMTTGKWYWEYTLGASGNGGRLLGIVNGSASTTNYVGSNSNGWGYYGGSGQKYNNNSASAYGASYTNGDVIGVAFDADAGTLVFYKNGTSQGTAFSSLTSGPYFPAWSAGDAGQTGTTSLNFGQRPFAYTAPSGYKALCTQNLPTPTIGATTATQAGKYFNPVLYTGNGSSRSITGLGFQPDFTWIKARSVAYSHRLADSVRGAGKELYSDDTAAEVTNSANGYVTSFDSDGFSLGTGIGVNANTQTFVAWNWRAGNNAGSTNTAGSITSTVSANTTSGFSIATYTGNGTSLSTVGHGLGAVPSMVIVKARSAAGLSWYVYQKDVGNTKFLELNSSAAPTTFNLWESTNPTSSVFTISNNAAINGSGTTFVAYCFAPVAGYSAFGSYTGNGSADGPFVYCGFRPAYVMIKSSTVGGSAWVVFDNKRNTFNVVDKYLLPNASDAEASFTGIVLDFTSNGFKIRGSQATVNNVNDTYIFMALAENPFKYSLAR